MRWVPLTILLLTTPAAADEVRLSDGRVLVGDVQQIGDRVVVHTRDGVVEVPAAEIVSVRTEGELRRELRELAKGRGASAFDQLQLARLARDYGLSRELWDHLDRAIAADPAPDTAVARLTREFLDSLGPELLPSADELEPLRRVRKLVNIARPGAGAGRCAAVAAQLARLQGVDAELFEQARRATLPEQRVAANEALLLRGGDRERETAWLHMLIDDDRDARRAIARLAGRLTPTRDALAWLAPAFLHDSPPIRIHAADAVAAIGDADLGARLIAVAGPYAGTPVRADGSKVGVRAHMQATLQTSYIRDFDVEIAQAAAVANPVIDTVTSGVVLDVKVAAVISRRVEIEQSYRRALHELLGVDPGADPRSWAAVVAARD